MCIKGNKKKNPSHLENYTANTKSMMQLSTHLVLGVSVMEANGSDEKPEGEAKGFPPKGSLPPPLLPKGSLEAKGSLEPA